MNPRAWKRPKWRRPAPTSATGPVTETAWLLHFALSLHDPGRVGSLVQNAAEQRPRCLVVTKYIELIRHHRLRRRRRNGDEGAPTDAGEALGIAGRAICNRITAEACETDSDECGKRLHGLTTSNWRLQPSIEAAPLGDSRFGMLINPEGTVSPTANGFMVDNGGGSLHFAVPIPEPKAYVLTLAGPGTSGFTASLRRGFSLS